MTTWKESTEKRYWEMLEVLPPAAMTGLGFLVGEPFDHGTCTVKGFTLPRYSAFAEIEGPVLRMQPADDGPRVQGNDGQGHPGGRGMKRVTLTEWQINALHEGVERLSCRSATRKSCLTCCTTPSA
jgi:hypothetical protein